VRSHLRRLTGYAIAMFAASALLVGPPAARAVDAPYFASNGSQESMLSEMAIHPSALRIGSVTYLAYQGPGFDPYVASYDESSGEWAGPVRVGINPLSLDAHGAPALFADSAGYLHVLYGSHFLPMKHAVSARPGSIDSWIELQPPSTAATYPQPIHMPDGSLLVFYRQGSADYYGWVFRVSHDGGRTWNDGYSTVLAGYSSNGWYAHFAEGAGGIVHCAFTRYDPNSSDTYLGRDNLYYIWRDHFGTWRNIHGDPVTMPVTRATADEECGVYESGTDVVNEVVVKDDPSATRTPAPLIQFITGTGRGEDAYRWAFVRPVGGSWKVGTVTLTDHSFDAATFDPHADGSIDSYLVTGGSLQNLTRLDPMEGRGGTIERWTSADHGNTWSFAERVSPDEPGSLFSDPQVVAGASATSTVMFTEWSNDHTDFFHRLYLWGSGGGLVHRPTDAAVDRLAGPDRIQTAVAASKAGFAEGAETVLLATSRDYPDALAAAPLALALHGPVLLVPRDYLPDSVRDEIRRLAPAKVVILGSEVVVRKTVETDVLAQTGVKSVERIAGADRYGTALAVARRLHDVIGPLHSAVIVSGRNFPDALSAAPLAAWAGYPILLAEGDVVSTSTREAFDSYDVASTLVIGSGSVVSTAYASQLPLPTRLWGKDRFATSAAVARYGLGVGLLSDRVVVASGMGFPDALSGSVLAARARAPMLLSLRSGLPTPCADVLSDVASRTVQVWVMGGPPVVDDAAMDGIVDRLRAP
jgi:putative cell wall-binding protein